MPEETFKNRLEAENLQLRQAVEELSILNEIAFAIGSQTEVDKLSELIVSKCTKKIKAEQGCILLLSEDESSPFKTYDRKIEHTSKVIPIHLSTTLMGWMIKNQKPFIIDDLKSDKRFQTLDRRDFRSLLMVPLKLKNKLTGLLCLFNKEGEFTAEDQRLLSIIAVQSAQVIENARLAGSVLIAKISLVAVSAVSLVNGVMAVYQAVFIALAVAVITVVSSITGEKQA